MHCISGPSARWDEVLTKSLVLKQLQGTLWERLRHLRLNSVPWLSEDPHANWASGQASRALTATDLCLQLFHMLLESGQYTAWFVTCELLIVQAASGTCYYEDLVLLKRSSILLSSSSPAAACFPFFCSYTAISPGGVGVLLGLGDYFFCQWTTIHFFQHVVLHIWQEYQEEINMQEQSWPHLQLQLPQITSCDVPSRTADIF